MPKSSSLLADLRAAVQPVDWNRCTFGKWLATLDDDNRAAVLEFIADLSYGHKQVADAITRLGLTKVTPDTISRHRNGECVSCKPMT